MHVSSFLIVFYKYVEEVQDDLWGASSFAELITVGSIDKLQTDWGAGNNNFSLIKYVGNQQGLF